VIPLKVYFSSPPYSLFLLVVFYLSWCTSHWVSLSLPGKFRDVFPPPGHPLRRTSCASCYSKTLFFPSKDSLLKPLSPWGTVSISPFFVPRFSAAPFPRRSVFRRSFQCSKSQHAAVRRSAESLLCSSAGRNSARPK